MVSFLGAGQSGEIIAGRYVELAVRRYLDDIEHAHERGLYFDADIAEKSLQFVETVCTHQKAEWAGQPFLLSPNQQFILWNLTGWRRENGCRRPVSQHGGVVYELTETKKPASREDD